MKSISEISALFKAAGVADLPELIGEYSDDERGGVRKLIEGAKKKIAALEAEKKRIYALSEFERQYADCRFICGIDEVGRGPLAGPVCAGAVILPKDCSLLYLNDSKQLSAKKREELSSSHICFIS